MWAPKLAMRQASAGELSWDSLGERLVAVYAEAQRPRRQRV